MNKTEKFVSIEELIKLSRRLMELAVEADQVRRDIDNPLLPAIYNGVATVKAEFLGRRLALEQAAQLVQDLINTGVCNEEV